MPLCSFSPPSSSVRTRCRGRRTPPVADVLSDSGAEVLRLPWAWPTAASRRSVIPVFLPFQGCPVRCVFCAQDVQTGLNESLQDMKVMLQRARDALRRRAERGCAPAELAFYGGTFTALPETILCACLSLVAEARERGWVASFRCSTRPDCVAPAVLERLVAAGCTTVELGVQSFAGESLAAARRGYDAACARRACACVRAAGLQLGVQLLPGMPGNTPQIFLDDVAQALQAGAHMLRFYPCLVLDGTMLANLWREGQYEPWPLECTLDTLAAGWLISAQAGVPVIRMGLAPEAALQRALLAGPADPALGSRVMGRALLLAVRQALLCHGRPESNAAFELYLPCAVQGCLWGNRGELRAVWAELGLRAVYFGQDSTVAIRMLA